MPDTDLFVHRATEDATTAEVTVDADRRADHEVDDLLFAKFCEHLGNNIYHGMEAQILFNPVFGEWHFRGDGRPSGGYGPTNDPEAIRETVEDHGRPLAYPESTDTDALLAAYGAGLAFGWLPTADGVTASPDTGPAGNRAQRVEGVAGEGVEQRTRLPLHRVEEYEFRCKVRAPESTTVRLTVATDDGEELAATDLAVGEEWTTVGGAVTLPEDVDPDGVYRVSLTAPAAFVVERLLVYPADHVEFADPEVIDFLRDSGLSALRWPGGNFVSGYDFRDGIGPVDERPTRANPNWEGLEYNLFGTDEFVRFCENVGCEPTICINAGDGTPQDAADWVEYCNGDRETEMGRLRAVQGHPEPYDITYWEVGNELWGKWQVNWSTPEGYADRYERFREAMLAVDPDIELTACGLETNDDPDNDALSTNGRWNDTLLEQVDDVRAISDHVLAGGQVSPATDPRELFRAFMGYSMEFGAVFRDLETRMQAAGVEEPRFDLTELQLFADIGDGDADSERLTAETLPTPDTATEALYDACIRNEMIRMGPFAEMLTHSATVNHGGGLQKAGERVWADPCHYGRALTAALAGDTPLGVEVACSTISTTQQFREISPVEGVPAVDVMATEGADALRVVLVNRTSHGEPIDVTVDLGAFDPGDEATIATLGAETWHERNTREHPEHVTPDHSTASVPGDTVELALAPYSMVRLTVPEA